jgi:hypothetical protein
MPSLQVPPSGSSQALMRRMLPLAVLLLVFKFAAGSTVQVLLVGGSSILTSSTPVAVATSTDGLTFTAATSPWDSTTSAVEAWGGAWSHGGQRWVVTGPSPNFAYSDDGLTWTASTSTPFSTTGYCVAYSEDLCLWIAGGKGTVNTIATSSDNGVTWTGQGLASGTLNTHVSWLSQSRPIDARAALP